MIVELQAKPGKWTAFNSLLERIEATHGPRESGFLGSTHCGVLDNPDMLVEIADRNWGEVRVVAVQETKAIGVADCPI